MDGTSPPVICPSGECLMWWTIPISIGVGTGVGVGLKGGDWPEVLAWSALTSGTSAALGSRGFWSASWAGVRWVAPSVWGVVKALAGDSAIMGKAFTTTRTAAALGGGVTVAATIGVGATVGAITGTLIVREAEKKGIVYEGATADVLDFYTPGTGDAHYWDQGDHPTPGYFNIPGNVKFIASTYWNRWTSD